MNSDAGRHFRLLLLRPALLAALFAAALLSPRGDAQERPNSATTIPAGTILPVRLPGISSEHSKKGQGFRAKIMQDVPLPNAQKIRRGSVVLGHVVDVIPWTRGAKSTLALKFDTLVERGQSSAIVTNPRALASTLEVESAQTPTIGPGESDVFVWLPTTQVGGDVVYGLFGDVYHGTKMVGRSVGDGVLVTVSARPGSECRGAVNGNGRPQALWVFSSDACGTYGFPGLTISHAGRTDPVGVIVLTSNEGPVRIRAGSGALLRVQ